MLSAFCAINALAERCLEGGLKLVAASDNWFQLIAEPEVRVWHLLLHLIHDSPLACSGLLRQFHHSGLCI